MLRAISAVSQKFGPRNNNPLYGTLGLSDRWDLLIIVMMVDHCDNDSILSRYIRFVQAMSNWACATRINTIFANKACKKGKYEVHNWIVYNYVS